MKLKITHILLLSLFNCSLLLAQTENNEVDYVNPEDDYVVSFDSLSTKDKINYNFEMGVNIGSNGNYGTFYKPSVSYQVSPKFSIHTGMVYMNSSVNNFPVFNDYTYQSFSGSIAQYSAFVAGKYDLTDRLTVGGSIYYDFTSYDSFNGLSSASNSNLDNIGFSANFEYKVSKNMTISGEIRRGGNNNPFNSYRNSNFNSSFGNSFGSPFRTW